VITKAKSTPCTTPTENQPNKVRDGEIGMSETKFSTFVMSETTRNQINALPQDMQLKFFWAVTDFGLDGIEPKFDGIELAIWIPMDDLILNSKREDEAWRNKQRENGKKGGRPRKTPVNKETKDNPKNTEVIRLV
jgi:hypothetical protein